MSRRGIIFGAVMGCLAVCWMASAAPRVMRYQGRLTNSAGQPISAPTEVTFSFYNTDSGGSPIPGFSDSDIVTPNLEGIYATEIGDPSPGEEIPEQILSADPLYLNVNVGGEDLTPRMLVTPSTYALTAGSAQQISTQTFTSAESIQAGNLVTLDSAGLLHKAVVSSVTPTTLQSAYGWPLASTLLDANHTVIFYADSNNNYYATAVVATISGNTITYGAPVLVQTEEGGVGTEVLAAQAVGSDKVLLMYRWAGASEGYLRLATVSGDVLTVGDPVAFGDNYSSYFCMASLGPDKTLMAYSNCCYPLGRVVTTSGSTPELGTEYQLPSYVARLLPLGGSQFMLLNMTYATVLTVHEDDSITWGRDNWFGSGINYFNTISTAMGQLDATHFLYVLAGDDRAFIMLTTLNGDQLSVTRMYDLIGRGAGSVNIVVFSPSQALVLFNDGFAGRVRTMVVGVQGQDLGFGNSALIGTTSWGPIAQLLDSEHALVVLNAPGVGAAVVSPAQYGLNQYIGVAEQNVGPSTPCAVTVGGGITQEFSGLVPGNTYYVGDNGLSSVPSLSDEVVAGKALSSNRFLVRY